MRICVTLFVVNEAGRFPFLSLPKMILALFEAGELLRVFEVLCLLFEFLQQFSNTYRATFCFLLIYVQKELRLCLQLCHYFLEFLFFHTYGRKNLRMKMVVHMKLIFMAKKRYGVELYPINQSINQSFFFLSGFQ